MPVTEEDKQDCTQRLPLKGRGAVTSPANRFARYESDIPVFERATEVPKTTLTVDHAKSIIARNRSPDVPFEQSINPYKGCEHGCIYCFARPTHAYLDLSPGLDFETRIFYKPEAPKLLAKELNKASYKCTPIAFGTNTDPYQPIDKSTGLTRQLLEVLQAYRHPFTVVTKGSHLTRDLDILAEMAARNLCSVMISLTTANDHLKRIMEPRAAHFERRLHLIEQLHQRQISVGVLLAPVIPMINDHEMEQMLELAKQAGASSAGYVFLRLPLEVKTMFSDWLSTHFPERAEHVLNLIKQSRQGALNQSEFGKRMRGEGVFADLIRQRFKTAVRRLGFVNDRQPLDTTLFYQTRAEIAATPSKLQEGETQALQLPLF